MVVVDASAIATLLLNRPSAESLRERLLPELTLHTPHLLDLEVASVLRRALRRGFLTEAEAALHLADFEKLRLIRYPQLSFLSRIWELRANVTTYDAAYLALAEALAATLITTDGRLSRVPELRATVEVYGDRAT